MQLLFVLPSNVKRRRREFKKKCESECEREKEIKERMSITKIPDRPIIYYVICVVNTQKTIKLVKIILDLFF